MLAVLLRAECGASEIRQAYEALPGAPCDQWQTLDLMLSVRRSNPVPVRLLARMPAEPNASLQLCLLHQAKLFDKAHPMMAYRLEVKGDALRFCGQPSAPDSDMLALWRRKPDMAVSA